MGVCASGVAGEWAGCQCSDHGFLLFAHTLSLRQAQIQQLPKSRNYLDHHVQSVVVNASVSQWRSFRVLPQGMILGLVGAGSSLKVSPSPLHDCKSLQIPLSSLTTTVQILTQHLLVCPPLPFSPQALPCFSPGHDEAHLHPGAVWADNLGPSVAWATLGAPTPKINLFFCTTSPVFLFSWQFVA